jgi:hypothetical protein
MYKTLIRPVAMYGSESWNMTAADEHSIGVFKRKETFISAVVMPECISFFEKLTS